MEQKTIFPYKILNKDLKENMRIEEKMFEDYKEYQTFKEKNGSIVNTYKILEEYCKNDAKITKTSIIKF
jgi:hypothetical protein